MHYIDYNKQKLIDYLKPDTTVCLFMQNHGLGDQIMFRPLYMKLKELCPRVSFNFKAGIHQEFFDDLHTTKFDDEIRIGFWEHDQKPFVPNNMYPMAKPEVCAKWELGIPYTEDLEFTWKPSTIQKVCNIPKHTIGIAPVVNSNPARDMGKQVFELVWNTVKEEGFTPLEVLFNPPYQRAVETYPFVDFSCRNFPANIPSVYSVISQLDGFIGVNTGTLCCAITLGVPTLHMWGTKPFKPFYMKYKQLTESRFVSPYKCNKRDVVNFLNTVKERNQNGLY